MFQAELCLNALERCGYSSGQTLITLWLHTVIALEYSFAKVICCFTSLIRVTLFQLIVANMSSIFVGNRN